jgi:hypothetical protein
VKIKKCIIKSGSLPHAACCPADKFFPNSGEHRRSRGWLFQVNRTLRIKSPKRSGLRPRKTSALLSAITHYFLPFFEVFAL